MKVEVRYYTRSGNTKKLAEEEFYCKGSFGPMHKGKPDEKDCKAAAEFAKKIIS